MQTVVFEGKEYTKASVLAEQFRYTQDYLGQLCRAKKVDARLVGRAWYVNLTSLEDHRKTRYKTEPTTLKTESTSNEVPPIESQSITKKPPNHYLSRIDVEPVLRQKTVKILQNEAGKLKEFPVRYERDDFSLIPKVNRSAVSATLPISIADANEISIKKTKEHIRVTDFKAEALPEVYLKGKIGVVGIPEATEAVEEQPEEVVNPEPSSATPIVVRKAHGMVPVPATKKPQSDIKKPLKIKLISGKSKPEAIVSAPPVVPLQKSEAVIRPPLVAPAPKAPAVASTALSIKPLKPNEIRVVKATESAPAKPVAISSAKPEPAEQSSGLGILGLLFFLFGVLAMMGLILTAKSSTYVGPTGTESSVSFDVSQLEQVVEKIKSLR